MDFREWSHHGWKYKDMGLHRTNILTKSADVALAAGHVTTTSEVS
jgi:hypothetical protein